MQCIVHREGAFIKAEQLNTGHSIAKGSIERWSPHPAGARGGPVPQAVPENMRVTRYFFPDSVSLRVLISTYAKLLLDIKQTQN